MSDAKEVHSPGLLAMCCAHFNEPMLSSDKLVRCIGYGETGVDCYIIVREQGTVPTEGRVFWHTCVGGYIFLDRLRGQNQTKATNGGEWDDFIRLDNSLTLNGCPQEKAFRIELRHDDNEDGRCPPPSITPASFGP